MNLALLLGAASPYEAHENWLSHILGIQPLIQRGLLEPYKRKPICSHTAIAGPPTEKSAIQSSTAHQSVGLAEPSSNSGSWGPEIPNTAVPAADAGSVSWESLASPVA